MENLINKFLSDNITITEFCKQNHIKVCDFSNALRERGHYVYRNATLNVIKYLHLAINDYKTGNYSIEQLSKKYGISKPTLSSSLKRNKIEVVNPQNRVRFNEHIFDVIDSEEKAYWLGFIYADGYVESKHKDKQQYGFELSLADHDVDHLHKFNIFMEYDGDNVKAKSNVNAYRWSVRNKCLWNQLNLLGVVPNKSLILTFPDLSIFTKFELFVPFIRGYFDGDGCITYAEYKNIYSCRINIIGTKSFLESIVDLSKINGTISCDKRHGNAYELRFSKENSLKFADFIYNNANIYLDRKHNRYLKFKEYNNAVPKGDLGDY